MKMNGSRAWSEPVHQTLETHSLFSPPVQLADSGGWGDYGEVVWKGGKNAQSLIDMLDEYINIS